MAKVQIVRRGGTNVVQYSTFPSVETAEAYLLAQTTAGVNNNYLSSTEASQQATGVDGEFGEAIPFSSFLVTIVDDAGNLRIVQPETQTVQSVTIPTAPPVAAAV